MEQVKDPFHGVTLEMILNYLVEHIGWEEMGRIVNIRCFTINPSIKSSLQFLRKTEWARKTVEDLYLRVYKQQHKKLG
ncbi:MAG: DUF2132 domain-containing protein [Candidatus Omnitrophica bacterium]|nr:DUF2132 domain-containing protein [Candidatus Omnitrophota bacterium]